MLDTAKTDRPAATVPADHVAGDNALADSHRITIEHTFETAHRLPHLGGKCTSLHGHSWRVTVTVAAPDLSTDATVVEFGTLKAVVRRWIDVNLDHGTMLGFRDPLVEPLTSAGCKVFRFGADRSAAEPELLATDLAWPTVEAVAVVLRRMSREKLANLPRAAGAVVGRVFVRETQFNTADYGPEAS